MLRRPICATKCCASLSSLPTDSCGLMEGRGEGPCWDDCGEFGCCCCCCCCSCCGCCSCAASGSVAGEGEGAPGSNTSNTFLTADEDDALKACDSCPGPCSLNGLPSKYNSCRFRRSRNCCGMVESWLSHALSVFSFCRLPMEVGNDMIWLLEISSNRRAVHDPRNSGRGPWILLEARPRAFRSTRLLIELGSSVMLLLCSTIACRFEQAPMPTGSAVI
mmetsp:Transcript_25741/g.66273  ORF Transcript_25741/g.66273 Transcript_25741/m.66273 type:complete len:219 (-) Transcript_25741:2036-2692(-)